MDICPDLIQHWMKVKVDMIMRENEKRCDKTDFDFDELQRTNLVPSGLWCDLGYLAQCCLKRKISLLLLIQKHYGVSFKQWNVRTIITFSLEVHAKCFTSAHAVSIIVILIVILLGSYTGRTMWRTEDAMGLGCNSFMQKEVTVSQWVASAEVMLLWVTVHYSQDNAFLHCNSVSPGHAGCKIKCPPAHRNKQKHNTSICLVKRIINTSGVLLEMLSEWYLHSTYILDMHVVIFEVLNTQSKSLQSCLFWAQPLYLRTAASWPLLLERRWTFLSCFFFYIG